MHAPSIAPIGADGTGPRRRSQTLQAGSKAQSTTAMPQTEPRLPSRARMLQRGPRTGEPIAWAGQRGWMHRPSCPVASKSTPKQARPVLHLHTKSWFVERGHVKMHQGCMSPRHLHLSPAQGSLYQPAWWTYAGERGLVRRAAPAAHAMGSQVVGPRA